MDTKQPAARLQQILEILDSDILVTSEKYRKDLEKLDFKGTVPVSYTHLDVYKRQPYGLH